MNDKLRELLYDLQKTKDIYKAKQLITEYALKEPLSDLDDVLNIQCSSGNWDYDEYMQGMANGLILARACITGVDPKFLEAPEDGFLADKAEVEPDKCRVEQACPLESIQDVAFFKEREKEMNKRGLSSRAKFGIDSGIKKRASLEPCTCSEENSCLYGTNAIVAARKILRESFKDEGMKLGYMANMRMFINDRTDTLIDEQVIYDMIDYIFQE